MRKLTLLASTVALSAAMQAPIAMAQESPDDIIVTARKREESIMKVPVIQNILTQETLDRQQITTIQAISSRTPGLLIGTGNVNIGLQVSIRGVGTSVTDAGVDQSTSLNIDGLQLSQGLAYKAGVFDLAQVEILKGPQALFFGKSSPAGVISLRTADPGDKIEAILRAGYEFEARERRGEFIMSGPITDTFGIRFAAMHGKQDGFFYNRAVAQPGTGAINPRSSRFAPQENSVIRATALWKPTDTFSARLKANFTHDRINGDAGQGQLASCPDGTASPVVVNGTPVNYISPNDDCKLDRTIYLVGQDPTFFPGIRNGGTPFLDQNQRFGTLELNVEPIENVTLTSVTGYYHVHQDALNNGTQTGAAGTRISGDLKFDRTEYTQELRLNSDFSSPLNFTLGGFYQDGTANSDFIARGLSTPAVGTGVLTPSVLSNGFNHVKIKSKSLFGQLRYKPVETLEIAAGVRWTDETRTLRSFNRLLNGGVGDFVALVDPGDPLANTDPARAARTTTPKLSSKNWSPELTVTYTPTDDMTVFGSLKQGYKSGSFTSQNIPAVGANPSFGDEKVQGAELGLKLRAMDRQLNFNVAGYYYKYKGLQVGASKSGPSGLVSRVYNAGAARVYGIDFTTNYRPADIDGLDLYAAVNWNRAKFTRLVGVSCWGGQTFDEGCNLFPADTAAGPGTGAGRAQDLSGAPLVRAPQWQVNFGLNYDMPVGKDMTLSLGSDSQYSSRFLTALQNRSDFYQGAFFKTNATVALKGPDDHWEVALIGNNLTNKITTSGCVSLNTAAAVLGGGYLTGARTPANGVRPRGVAGVDEVQCPADRGRELWIRLTLRP